MITPAPIQLRAGDYVMNFPIERQSDRDTARQAMKRNGCKTIRFESSEVEIVNHENKLVPAKRLTAHGYVGRIQGPGVEEL